MANSLGVVIDQDWINRFQAALKESLKEILPPKKVEEQKQPIDAPAPVARVNRAPKPPRPIHELTMYELREYLMRYNEYAESVTEYYRA